MRHINKITILGTLIGTLLVLNSAKTQAQDCITGLSPIDLYYPTAGGSQVVTLTVQKGCTFTVDNPYGWISISTTSSTITVTCQAASAGQYRNGTLTVQSASGGGLAWPIYVNQGPPPAQPGTISGSSTMCIGVNSTYSIAPVTGATSYTWSFEKCTIVSGQGTTTVVVNSSGYGTRYLKVTAKNNYGTSPVRSKTITVSPLSVGGTASPSQIICSGTQPFDLSLSGQTGSVVKWQYASNSSFTTGVGDISTTSTILTSTQMGTLTSTRYYRAVVQSGPCSQAVSSTVTITVTPPTVAGTASASQIICSGTQPQNLTLAGYTGNVIGWQYASNSSFTEGKVDISGSASATLTSAQMGVLTATRYYRAKVQSGACDLKYSNVITIEVAASSTAPTGITGTTTICNGSSTTLTATGGTHAANAQYQWGTGTTVGSNIITGQNEASITVSPTTSNSYWVRRFDALPCGTYTGGISTLVTVKVSSTAPTGISGTSPICSGNSVTLTATGGTLGTSASYQWGTGTTIGSNIISGSSASITVSPTSTTTYWVRRVDPSPCSTVTSGVTKTITVNIPSTAPTNISGTSPICIGSSVTLTAAGGTHGTGATYQWGTGTTVGSNVISGNGSSITVTPSSTTSYWVRRIDPAPCSNTTSGVIKTITVNTPSTAPTSISGTTPVCGGSSVTLAATGGTLGAGATYQWGTGTTVGSNIISGTGASITVSPGSTTTYWVRRVDPSPCSTVTAGVTKTITVNTPSTAPTSISGTSPICSGNSVTLVALGGSLGDGSSYQWGTGSVVGSNIISGSGESISVSPTTTTTYWVRRMDPAPCNTLTSGVLKTIIVNTVPAQPSVISESNTPCIGGNVLYSVTNVSGVTYTWTKPADWIGSSTSSSIQLTVGASNGTVVVTPSNSCGTGPSSSKTVTSNNVPAQPSFITGETEPCEGQSEPYSVTSVPGVTYNWSFPSEWTQTSGGTGNSITATVGSGSGNITVIPTNTCGNGTSRTLSVQPNILPLQPLMISGDVNPCEGTTGLTYWVENTSGVNYTWTVPTGWAITNGQGGSSITVTAGSSSGSITVTPINACGTGPAQTLEVEAVTVPVQPYIVGPLNPCQGAEQVYFTPDYDDVTYSWDIPSSWTLISGNNTNQITVRVWLPGTITVTLYNDCGAGTPQTLAVDPITAPGYPSPISGDDVVCANSTHTYSIPEATGATHYIWYVPEGSTIIAGASTTEITVTFGETPGNISVKAANSCHESTLISKEISFSFPTIYSHPDFQNVAEGGVVEFTTISLNTDVYYQWQVYTSRNPLWVNIEGETDQTLTFNANIGQDGNWYKCMVYNDCDTVYSYQAQLTVIPAQPITDWNYVKTKVYHSPNAQDPQQEASYFDGLGRLIQKVAYQQSPSMLDVVQHVDYDALGRQAKQHLPYVSGSDGNYKVNALSQQKNFYQNVVDESMQTIYPFAETVFEPSPLNRVTEQGAPGEEWQPGEHSVGYEYTTNIENEVIRWKVDGIMLDFEGYYLPGTLTVTVTKDENWISGELHTTREYKNLQGNTLLKVNFAENEQGVVVPHKTYYVYDDFDLLRYVLSPEGTVRIGTQDMNPIDLLIKNYCYYYSYDARKRMIAKQLPGAEPVYMVYDNRDRLVLSSDGNQRPFWSFTKYDAFNRPIITGEVLLGYSHFHDDLIEAFASYTGPMDETALIDTRSNIGYTLNASTPSQLPAFEEEDVLSVTFYDNYNFFTSVSAFRSVEFLPEVIINYTDNDGISNGYFDNVKGQVTGTLVKVIDGNEHSLLSTWLYSANYYDNRYRPIQTRGTLYGGNAGDTYTNSTRYHFNGQVEKTREEQSFAGITTATNTHLSYDHAWRLVKKEQLIDSDPNGWVTLATYAYNELGQQVTKSLGNGLQYIDFKYNIRGWLTDVNNVDNLGSDLFAMRLDYNSGENPQWNGNISAQEWKHAPNGANPNPAVQGYSYAYDALNRLTEGKYNENRTTNNWFNELLSYDQNGNILTLTRTTEIDGEANSMDIMDYSYNGNAMRNVTDAGDQVAGFRNANGTDHFITEYTYDANGNMTEDKNKGVVVEYNLLNLPKKVSPNYSNKIEYFYSAAGQKMLMKHTEGTTTKQYAYAGSLVYFKASSSTPWVREYQLTGEGRAEENGGTWDYQYFLADHLGNTRVVAGIGSNGEVVAKQTNDYYPFGLQIASIPLASDNRLKYNGKELQSFALAGVELDWYDYGARFYDPALGRWHAIDPQAERYNSMSPYVYVANNPMLFIDPNGEEIWIHYKDENGDKQKMQYTAGMEYKGDNKFISTTVASLNKINSGENGKEIIKELDGSSNLFGITEGDKSTFESDSPGEDDSPEGFKSTINGEKKEGTGKGSGGMIVWNPEDNSSGRDKDGNYVVDPFVNLAHELSHGVDANKAKMNYRTDADGIKKGEYSACQRENLVRKDHNIAKRIYYGIRTIVSPSAKPIKEDIGRI